MDNNINKQEEMYGQGYDPNMSEMYGRGYNGNDMNYMQNTGRQKPVRRRKAGAVILSVFIAILLMMDIIVVSVKTGFISEGFIKEIVKAASDEIKEDRLDEITNSDDAVLEDMIDSLTEYVTDFMMEGVLPDRKELTETIGKAYDEIAYTYIDEILKNIEKNGGEVKTDELIYIDNVEEMRDFLGRSGYEEFIGEVKAEVGDTIIVNDRTRAEIEEKIKNSVDLSKGDKVAELTDEIYEMLDSMEDRLTEETDGISVQEIIILVRNFMIAAIAGLSAVIAIMVIITFIIDKDLYMSFKGMFATLLVPGILTLIPALLAKGILKMTMGEMTIDESVKAVINIIYNSSITPFIVIPAVVIAAGVICKIISLFLKKKEQ